MSLGLPPKIAQPVKTRTETKTPDKNSILIACGEIKTVKDEKIEIINLLKENGDVNVGRLLGTYTIFFTYPRENLPINTAEDGEIIKQNGRCGNGTNYSVQKIEITEINGVIKISLLSAQALETNGKITRTSEHSSISNSYLSKKQVLEAIKILKAKNDERDLKIIEMLEKMVRESQKKNRAEVENILQNASNNLQTLPSERNEIF